MDVACRCPECRDINFVRVEKGDYFDWKRGKYAQNAFPYLNAAQREMLMTGICGACWDLIFGDFD
jgi:hypothetical protein